MLCPQACGTEVGECNSSLLDKPAFTGGNDGYGTAPVSRQKKEQSIDADNDAMNAETQQASFRQAHNADLALCCM